jgi:hypothetical protein
MEKGLIYQTRKFNKISERLGFELSNTRFSAENKLEEIELKSCKQFSAFQKI